MMNDDSDMDVGGVASPMIFWCSDGSVAHTLETLARLRDNPAPIPHSMWFLHGSGHNPQKHWFKPQKHTFQKQKNNGTLW